jgi:hypothetical protein
MDEVIAEAGRHDLMVILDNHSLANDGYMYDLWYDQGGYAEQDWIDNWRLIAARYRDTGNVVAFDLKNEPHGRATWGDGTASSVRRQWTSPPSKGSGSPSSPSTLLVPASAGPSGPGTPTREIPVASSPMIGPPFIRIRWPFSAISWPPPRAANLCRCLPQWSRSLSLI